MAGSVTNPATASDLFWEWNKTDVSQFTLVGSNPNPPTGALAVTTFPSGYDASELPILQYTHGVNGTTTRVFYEINDLPDLPDRFIFQGRIGPREATSLGANTVPGLLVAYQDVTHYMVLQPRGGGITVGFQTGNGNDGLVVGSQSSGTVNRSNGEEGSYLRVGCEYREPNAGADPGMRWWLDTVDDGLRLKASSGNWAGFGGGTNPSVAWDAGWRTGGTIKRLGIVFTEIAGGAGSGFADDLRIFTFAAA